MTEAWLVLAIASLGGLGALIRWRLQVLLPATPSRIITGVLVANTLGAFFAGFLLGLPTAWWSTAVLVGLCGSLTTLSTLALDIVEPVRNGRVLRAVVLASTHLVAGGVALFLGLTLASVSTL